MVFRIVNAATWLVLLGFITTPLTAQKLSQVTFKADLAGALNKGIHVACEWKVSKNSAMEIFFRYNFLEGVPGGALEGKWERQYALRRSYIFDTYSREISDDTGWDYLGDGRPLPAANTLGTSTSAARFGLGWRNYLYTGRKGLRFFVQPGVSLGVLETFEHAVERVLELPQSVDTWGLNSSNTLQAVTHTVYFTQFRETKYIQNWVGGASYQAGFVYGCKNGLTFELRAGGGVNVNGIKSAGKNQPWDFRPYYATVGLYVGYSFGHEQPAQVVAPVEMVPKE